MILFGIYRLFLEKHIQCDETDVEEKDHSAFDQAFDVWPRMQHLNKDLMFEQAFNINPLGGG